MAGTLITISDAFRAALVASGNTGTNAHKVTKIGLCNAAFDASNRKLTALPNELKRIDTFGGQNIDADTIHVTLQDSTAEQYTLWGFGFYLEDGTLAAYYSQQAADGPIMEKSPAAQLLLSVDVQFASIDAAALSFPSASFLNPPAGEDIQGVIELATQAEVDAGTDDARAVTPKKAATRYAPKNSPKLSGRVLIATTADDGTNTLQVAGGVKQASSTIDGGAGLSALYLSNNGKTRWMLGKRDTAETGNNAGGEFFLGAWKDDGTQVSVLTVSRASQVASFNQRPVFNGATPWDTANLNPANYATTADRDATNGQVSAKVNRSGDTMTSRLSIAPTGSQGDFGMRSGDGWWTYIRARNGGGLEVINNGYSAVTAWFDNSGRLYSNGGFQAGGAQFNNDGNIYMPFRGQWISDVIGDLYAWRDNLNAGKADRNANCQWNSGAWEGAAFTGANQRQDCPSPYVMVGQFLDPGGYWHMRGIVLRNN
ncbi:phage tail protein [Paraburkholderia sp. B3]|uniref:phage tail protein n=1 Tax=Paraburkholderia sp. B3 TaxID=3134791 RepID=UPI00398242DA